MTLTEDSQRRSSPLLQVAGTCESHFDAVRSLLGEQLVSGDELGASLHVDIDGTPVVDLWGGFRDEARSVPWTEDTITTVFSLTKTITNLAALILIDRGLVEPHAPVAKYWPEFADGGKEDVLVRHVLGHTSGVSGWEPPFSFEHLCELEASTRRLAAQTPWWQPGTASGYHLASQGHLVGEIVKRVTGMSLTAFVAEEVAGPLGADFQIGARESDWSRIAAIVPAPPAPMDPAMMPPPESPSYKTLAGLLESLPRVNTPEWRRAEIGAVNGHGNARSVARIARALSLGGVVGGRRVISAKTVSLVFEEQSHGIDLVTGVNMRFGIGYGLPETKTIPYVSPRGPDARVCFWGGLGGSLVVMDTESRVTISYVMNKLAAGIIGSDRAERYLRAIHDGLRASTRGA